MTVNDLGKSVGFTKRNEQDLDRACRDCKDVVTALKALEEITGDRVEQLPLVTEILRVGEGLRERFFTPVAQAPSED